MTRFGLASAIDLRAVHVWQPLPEVSDCVKFACAMSIGAQNFELTWRRQRTARRASGQSGCWSIYGYGNAGMTVHLEAFGETQEALQSAISLCLQSYHSHEFHTRFSSPEQIDGEWIALGSRYAERNWT